jgi:hypothetical protein
MIKRLNELAIIPKLPLSIGDHCIVKRAAEHGTLQPIGYDSDFRKGGLNDAPRFNVARRLGICLGDG